MLWFWVALAGGLGAATRFAVDALVARIIPGRIPLGTIVINVTGSFLLGLIAGWWAQHGAPTDVRTVLATGLMGGYTTFSTASVEGWRLIRGGMRPLAIAHAVGMLILSLTGSALGWWLTTR